MALKENKTNVCEFFYEFYDLKCSYGINFIHMDKNCSYNISNPHKIDTHQIEIVNNFEFSIHSFIYKSHISLLMNTRHMCSVQSLALKIYIYIFNF